MFTSNHFADLSAFISPGIMKTYIIIMILMVVGGTVFDVLHKKSAEYFFRAAKKSKERATKELGSAEMTSLAIQTAVVEGLTSGEFCNPHRRIAHLLTMYGFVLYVLTTIIMVFSLPAPAGSGSAFWPFLWYVGALMVCGGGYWFWFFIRVDVASEGHSMFRLVRADLFIVSLVGSVTLGLIWALAQSAGSTVCANVFLGLYLLATTILFGSIPWSKFSHMFFKPAAAFQKRVEQANGSRRNLPAPADSPEMYGSARRQPQNY
jgi:hypothetical protein